MGVISCDKKDCNGIMCQYHTPSGDVCWECKDAFIEYVKSKGKDMLNINKTLSKWLDKPKKNTYGESFHIEETLNKYFEEHSRH